MFTDVVEKLRPQAVDGKLLCPALVQYRNEGEWVSAARSVRVLYLADWYCDLTFSFREVRIITECDEVLYP